MSAAVINRDTPPLRHRLTVTDFHRMAEAGILGEDDRVELIDGELFDMSPIGSRHAGTVLHLTGLFNRAVGDTALVSVQNPVMLGEHSEPEPDIALLRPRSDVYTCSHPEAKDVLLLIEVADTSVGFDRDVKTPLYARHEVPEIWLLDLTKRCLEIHRRPSAEGYRVVLRPDRDDRISPELLPSVLLVASQLFVA
jgi:Uma2 family endonuclease